MLGPASRLPMVANLKPGARYVIGTADPALGHLLSRYLKLIEGFARREGITVTKTKVGAYHDPEENTDQLVVSQWVKLPEDATMDYWDHLGTEIENWVNTLDQNDADLVAEWIALEVRPDAADEAA